MSSAEFIQFLEKETLETRLLLQKTLKQLSISGDLSSLKEQLTQASTTEISSLLADQPWVDLPDPPAPTGINQFPVAPEAKVVGKQTLPNKKIEFRESDGLKLGEIELYDQVISITGKWNRIVCVTATPDTPFEDSIVVTTGTSNTESFETSLSISAGVDILGMASLETTLSTTFGQSFTFFYEKAEGQVFKVTPTTQKISACWWQGIFDFTLSRKARISYSVGEIFDLVFEAYLNYFNIPQTFKNQDKIFVSTQYPPYEGSSLAKNKFIITD